MPLHNTLRTDLSKVNISPFRCNERRSDLVKICSMVDINNIMNRREQDNFPTGRTVNVALTGKKERQ